MDLLFVYMRNFILQRATFLFSPKFSYAFY